MEFRETEEQGMIREMVRGFAEEVLAPTCLKRDRDQIAPINEWLEFCERLASRESQFPRSLGKSC